MEPVTIVFADPLSIEMPMPVLFCTRLFLIVVFRDDDTMIPAYVLLNAAMPARVFPDDESSEIPK